MSSYQMDLKVKPGYTMEMVFNAMKSLQERTDVIENGVTISFDEKITMTAGFYASFNELYDLFLGIMWKDKVMIQNHIKNVLSKYVDTGVLPEAIDNICESLKRNGYVLTREEKEELLELCNTRQK